MVFLLVTLNRLIDGVRHGFVVLFGTVAQKELPTLVCHHFSLISFIGRAITLAESETFWPAVEWLAEGLLEHRTLTWNEVKCRFDPTV